MYRRLFAFILAFVMVFSMVPVTAFAAEEEQKTEPVVTEPAVQQPKATEPKAAEPKVTEPKAAEPQATKPAATEPKATEAPAAEPQATEPKASEPAATEPPVTEPPVTEPPVTEPPVTEPPVTEPPVTEPPVTEPPVTEPLATEPLATEPPVTEPPVTEPKKVTFIAANLVFEFPEDSGLTDANIGTATVILEKKNGEDWLRADQLVTTAANGWSAYFELSEGGTYKVSVTDVDVEGYEYAVAGNQVISLAQGENETETYTVRYTKIQEEPAATEPQVTEPPVTEPPVTEPQATEPPVTEPASGSDKKREGELEEGDNTLIVSLTLAEDSDFTDVDIENIHVYLYDDCFDEQYESKYLNSDGRAEFVIWPGKYAISVSVPRVEGYVANVEGEVYITVTAGEETRADFTLNYLKEEATLKVSLDFTEDSAFGDEDVGDIIAEIYDGNPDDDGELVDTIVLPKGSRSGELTVPAKSFYNEEYDEWRYEYSYYLKLNGEEKTGYRLLFFGADYGIEDLGPGSEDGWNVAVKYVKAEHDVTVRVRLSEDSDISASDLKEAEIVLQELDEGMIEERVSHTGSANFAHTFTGLPTSEFYRLDIQMPYMVDGYEVTVQSVTCTTDVLSQNPEELQVNFPLDKDCEIEVVLAVKEPRFELTVVARFAEDSALKAEDFPAGITLISAVGWDDGVSHLGDSFFVAPANNWTSTKMARAGYFLKAMVTEQPEGYTATVRLFDSNGEETDGVFQEGSIVVYAEICYVEAKPIYLDVELVFAEDSVVQAANSESIYLNVDGAEKSFEFSKETGWHRILELDGVYDGFDWATTCVFSLSGLENNGYQYSVRWIDGNIRLDWLEKDLIPGETYNLVVEICYTPVPGKLEVQLIGTPFGRSDYGTVTVRDVDGNVIAVKDTMVEDDEDEDGDSRLCVFDLTEAGAYVISCPGSEEGSKTIQFDPAKGAHITFVYEERMTTQLIVRKDFGDGSALTAEDFPDGVTITVTESSGAFTGTYTLSDENGWQINLQVPNGLYTAVETGADRDGFVRTTLFTYRYIIRGGESLRGWGRSGDSATMEKVTDAQGGPYYVRGDMDVENSITVNNIYTRDGSISIKAGEGFYEYPSEKLDGGLDSGYEADEYSYRVVIDGQEQIITVKAGETYTVDGLTRNTQYSVTPILPDGYAWNAETTPITGTIGSDTNDDSTWDVEIDFTNDYYYAYEDGVLTIIKTDAKTGETLEGAVFGLFADKACTKQVATATSGEGGICTFTFDKDSIGTYYIKELQAPTHYHVVSEEIRAVTVKTEWATDEIDGTKVIVKKITATVAGLNEQDGGFPWVNERRTGSITITAGDGFYIYGGDELPGNPGSGYEAEEYTYRVVIDGQEQTVTLKPGESITLKDIDAGSEYSITPALPKGYDWNADESTISGTIGSEEEDDDESWNVEVDFENLYYYTYADGTVTIIKTDDLTGKPLKGAVFGFYSDRRCTDLIATATSGEDGICTFAVKKAGTYYIRELEAPADYYIRDRYVHEVTVKAKWETGKIDGTKVIKQKLTASVAGLFAQDGGYIWVNERRTTDLSVTKIFAHDENLERPKRVMIVLYQDGLVYDTVELSEANNWTHVWEKVPMGFEYVVDELDVAPGYYKQITRDGYDFTVVNTGALIPQTGDESMIVFWSAMALLSLCGMAFLMEKKRLAR